MKDNHPLTAEIAELVARLIRQTGFGTLALTVQDSRIVQVERNERFQFPAVKHPARRPEAVPGAEPDPLPGIRAALTGLQFGQVSVKIQNGRAIQIDRTEKRRWSELMGLGGDGI